MSATLPIRLLVALSLASLLFGVHLFISGAPTRVLIADGLGLVAMFVVPALFVGSVADLKKKWIVLLPLILFGAVLYDYLFSAQVTKADFAEFALIMYPIMAIVATGLLTLHAIVAQYLQVKGAA